MRRPLCFVLMPFGKKPSGAGTMIDFDAVYRDLIAPAINDAGLDSIRADEEIAGGIIHKPMYERLILCEFAVADLTTANANVFYELGVRHAVRPHSTALIFAEESRLPFDVGPLRAMPYRLNPDGSLANVESDRAALTKNLAEAKKAVAEGSAKDSPIFQLVEDFPEIDHTKTDVFRDRVQYAAELKERIAKAKEQGVAALRAVEGELGPLGDIESGVVIDLFLSYRGVEAWQDMIDLVKKMPRPLAETVMVQEQLAFALNRAKQSKEAEKVLKGLLQRRGPSSETCGLLGRVYKDRWEEASKGGETFLAEGLLDEAIEAYLQGFEADWRDTYPGINAVTLMEIKEPPDERRLSLLPVVTYAADRRISSREPDYWDYATCLEAAILSRDEKKAKGAVRQSLPLIREIWEPKTTVRNLRLIREARQRRGESIQWADEIEQALERRAQK